MGSEESDMIEHALFSLDVQISKMFNSPHKVEGICLNQEHRLLPPPVP